jgi:hypothetical protein
MMFLRSCVRNAVDMVTPTPKSIPTEPIGSIPRPVDLIERVANYDSEDPNRFSPALVPGWSQWLP